jgi:UDP-glucose 4,6-dehydratase
MKILVTGGSGFIGSNFINFLLTSPEIIGDLNVINLDNQTYAGKGNNIEHMSLDKNPNYKFIKGDISDKPFIEELFNREMPEIVFNFAAESHVDRSIESSEDFVMSNVVGSVNLFDASVKNKVSKFIQISTDEVYGSAKEGSFHENSNLNPSSPYSSSKSSADLIALSYFKTHKLPVIISRSANNFGPYQFPEKILPLFITNLLNKTKVPLMWSSENPGLNVRDWLHVEDNCRAIWFLANHGEPGEIYNIPGENEMTNIDVTRMLLKNFQYEEDMIEKVEHRKAHDFRYSIKGDKLKNLGFIYKHKDLEKGMSSTIEWYKSNKNWWGPLKNKIQIKPELANSSGRILNEGHARIKYLILGNGYLGNKFYNFLENSKLSDLRIEDESTVIKEIEDCNPDFVINCIGKTGRPNVDWCEDNKEETMQSNVLIPGFILRACLKTGKKMVHIGSGCIYEGDNGGIGFSEEDKPNFFGSYYSKTKTHAENILKDFNVLQIRVRIPIDDHPDPRNLITKLLGYNKILIVQNSITYVPDLLSTSKFLMDQGHQGIFNVTNSGSITYDKILKIYQDLSGKNLDYNLISPMDLDSMTKAKRSNCILSTKKLQNLMNIRDINKVLPECLKKYHENELRSKE